MQNKGRPVRYESSPYRMAYIMLHGHHPCGEAIRRADGKTAFPFDAKQTEELYAKWHGQSYGLDAFCSLISCCQAALREMNVEKYITAMKSDDAIQAMKMLIRIAKK